MTQHILVAYATHRGSTVDVAAAIAESLRGHGLAVDVRPIAEVTDLAAYDAVVLGSAVHRGAWLPEAQRFVEAHREALQRVPTALFCVHVSNKGDDEASRARRRAYLDGVRPLVQPVSEAWFMGRFDRHGASLLLPPIVSWLVPPMDFRDYGEIRAWADSLPARLVA